MGVGVYWNPWAVPLLVVAMGEGGLATLVYRARPEQFKNRVLALLLAADAAGWGLMAFRFSVVDPSIFYIAFVAAQVAWVVSFTAYMAFLGTLDTSLSRPLGTRAARIAMVLFAVVLSGLHVLWPEAFFPEVVPGSIARWETVFGTPGMARWVLTATGFLYAVLVGFFYLRRSGPGGPPRIQAKAYLAAFALRDFSFAGPTLVGLLTGARFVGPVEVVAWTVGYGGFAVLLAYGILRYQLFEIDLRIKWTLEKSTIAAVFGAVFLIVSEGLETLLDVDGTLYGIGAAIIIGLAFRRVERWAARVADRLMPGVEHTEDYLRQRKLDIYRGAVEDATRDGVVTEAERDVLDGLRARLGLSKGRASRIERAAGVGSTDPSVAD